MALERFDEAIDCCERCLRFDRNNEDIRVTYDKAVQQKAEKDKKDRKKQDRIRREREKRLLLQAAFKVGNHVLCFRHDAQGDCCIPGARLDCYFTTRWLL